MIPLRTAYRISSGALCRLSFCKMCVRWVSTVYRLRLSSAAISLLVLPSATSCRTSRSQFVNSSWLSSAPSWGQYEFC